MMPSASIIQNSTSEPISGVTMNGSSVAKITTPFSQRCRVLTASASRKPSSSTIGVVAKV